MPLPTGAPDPSVIIFAIQRGEYDETLALIAHAIRKRRENVDRLGIIKPSRGDDIEMFDDELAPEPIRALTLRVVGFTENGLLRARFLAHHEHGGKLYEQGRIIKIKRDWVYRVHFRD